MPSTPRPENVGVGGDGADQGALSQEIDDGLLLRVNYWEAKEKDAVEEETPRQKRAKGLFKKHKKQKHAY